MRNDELASLVDSLRSGTLSRREFLRRAAALGISLVAAQSLLSTFATRAWAAAGGSTRGGGVKGALFAGPAGVQPGGGPRGRSPRGGRRGYSPVMGPAA